MAKDPKGRSGTTGYRKVRKVGAMPTVNQRYNVNQMKFFMEVLRNGGNYTQAYRVAYNYDGKHANIHAQRVLSLPGAREMLASMQERAYMAAGIDAQQVLGATAQVAFHNHKDLYDKKGKPIPIHKLPIGVAMAVKKMEVFLDNKGKIVETKYESRDGLKALNMLGNHLGIFKPDGNAEVNVNLIVERMNAGRQRALEARNAAMAAKPVEVTTEPNDDE